MKVVPDNLYTVNVYFNEMLGRWFAKFTSNKVDVSYEFPLIDVYTGQHRPELGEFEETVLALVFSQMVAQIRVQQQRQAPPAPMGLAEQSLS